jgi:hypothetical protein
LQVLGMTLSHNASSVKSMRHQGTSGTQSTCVRATVRQTRTGVAGKAQLCYGTHLSPSLSVCSVVSVPRSKPSRPQAAEWQQSTWHSDAFPIPLLPMTNLQLLNWKLRCTCLSAANWNPRRSSVWAPPITSTCPFKHARRTPELSLHLKSSSVYKILCLMFVTVERGDANQQRRSTGSGRTTRMQLSLKNTQACNISTIDRQSRRQLKHIY